MTRPETAWLLALTLVAAVIAALILVTDGRGTPASQRMLVLQARITTHQTRITGARRILLFFHQHPKLLYAGGMRTHRREWRIVLRARATISAHGWALLRDRVALERATWANEGWTTRPWWMDPEWWWIARCESGSNPPNWRHNSGTYQGGLGFYRGSWDQFKPAGYPAEAYQATPWQQVVVAERIRARYGYTGWGCA